MCFFHYLVNQFLYAKYWYCQAQLQLQLQLSWELSLELFANSKYNRAIRIKIRSEKQDQSLEKLPY